jgi:hypothetical protein
VLPDFETPAFTLTALVAVHFRATKDGGGAGPYRSDYRCQLRYPDEPEGWPDSEVRVYFVGREELAAGEDAPAVLAFLDWERQLGRCRSGRSFVLREGSRITASGIIHAVAKRNIGS